MVRIKFKGEPFLLVDRAITTEERYRTGVISFAYWFSDGTVRRYGEVVGADDDIEFVEPADDVEMTPEGIENLWAGIFAMLGMDEFD